MTSCRLAIALACLSLLVSPVAGLYCGGDDPAAMACCQREAPECNQPGMTDDCCRTQPTDDGQAVSVAAAKARELTKDRWTAGLLDAVPALRVEAELPGVALAAGRDHVPRGLRPASLSVLRI